MSEEQELKTIPAWPFLHDTGLLFHINRQILHPLGLAMMVNTDEGVIAELWDCRQDPEGVLYSEAAYEDANKRHMKFMKDFGDAKIAERVKTLGYIVQGWSPADLIETPTDKELVEEILKFYRGLTITPDTAAEFMRVIRERVASALRIEEKLVGVQIDPHTFTITVALEHTGEAILQSRA